MKRSTTDTTFERYFEGPRIYVVRDKTESIPLMHLNPSYTDARFTEPFGAKTIFLAEGYNLDRDDAAVHGVHYSYSDRLLGWCGSERYGAAFLRARERFPRDTAAYFEAALREIYGDENLELIHMLTGVNVSTFYSYQVFGTVAMQKAAA